MALPYTDTLLFDQNKGVLEILLNRPERKNAMNGELLDALLEAFAHAQTDTSIRLVVVRGVGGTFSAGADLKDLAERNAAEGADPVAQLATHNRRFGAISEAANDLDVPLVAVVEGVALGGGFGLACVADITLAHRSTLFGLPETQLGLVPAQIAPFVMQRIGYMKTRRLALTAARFSAEDALALGLVDGMYPDTRSLDEGLSDVIERIMRCGPEANRATKRLLREMHGRPDSKELDRAANVFARCSLGKEGREGTAAFNEKRPPNWRR